MAKLIVSLDLDALELDTVALCPHCHEALDDDRQPLERFLAVHAQPPWAKMLLALTDRVGESVFINGKLDPRTNTMVQKVFAEMMLEYVMGCKAAYQEDKVNASDQIQQQEGTPRKHPRVGVQRLSAKAGRGHRIQ